ncbi:hypothetical protein HWV62_39898 [Athelia sp. TMB]|nr:hypothetical protein HWV62_39898 [Athelia sp. TMB]
MSSASLYQLSDDSQPRLERLDGKQVKPEERQRRRISIEIESVAYFRKVPNKGAGCAILLKTHFRLQHGECLSLATLPLSTLPPDKDAIGEDSEVINISDRHPRLFRDPIGVFYPPTMRLLVIVRKRSSPDPFPFRLRLEWSLHVDVHGKYNHLVDGFERLMSWPWAHEGWCFEIAGNFNPDLAQEAFEDAQLQDPPTFVGLHAAVKPWMDSSSPAPGLVAPVIFNVNDAGGQSTITNNNIVNHVYPSSAAGPFTGIKGSPTHLIFALGGLDGSIARRAVQHARAPITDELAASSEKARHPRPAVHARPQRRVHKVVEAGQLAAARARTLQPAIRNAAKSVARSAERRAVLSWSTGHRT